MKQFAIDRLLETMTKYESDEWSKEDYIHMLKHCAKMSIIDEQHHLRMTYLNGYSDGVKDGINDNITVDLGAQIEKYITTNFETR
jgi:hypothetical protein